MAHGVLTHTGCPLDLWVCVSAGAMQSMGKLWREFAHAAFLETQALELIAWDEFWEAFYSHYFSATIRVK